MYSEVQRVQVEETLTLIEQEYYRQITEYNSLRTALNIHGSDEEMCIEQAFCIKALIVMLYSMYEGFIKYASLQYVILINKLQLNTGVVKSCFAAASLNEMFYDVESGQKKCELFRHSLPEDAVLHRLFRRSVIVEHLRELWDIKVNINSKYINTESNLTYEILSRTLYSIGLEHNSMQQHIEEIEKLLRFRNPIAHGETISDMSYLKHFGKIEKSIKMIIGDFRNIIKDAIINEKFLKESA
ncbi:MAG TPA: MAE_28990/MAE_18760 family HEPN-like nuclease [Clostridia bacterium]|nr:MAE_28990/MAE_18760 family HEPN-like nuclease [Clostridia bacterium]